MGEPRLRACSECGEPVRLVHRFPDGMEPPDYQSHSAVEQEAAVLDVERLARALVTSGLMHRFLDYAQTAHSATMQKEDETTVARTWAAAVAAKYVRSFDADDSVTDREARRKGARAK
jgi:hypothetical protein